MPCRLSVPGRALDGVVFGVVLDDRPKGLAVGLFGLGEVRLIDGEICKEPLSEDDSSIEWLGRGGVDDITDITLVLAGDTLVSVFGWGSEGRVEDRAGLLAYIDMVLVDPATDLRGAGAADNESLFVEF